MAHITAMGKGKGKLRNQTSTVIKAEKEGHSLYGIL
jgi:hypothetical protein